ncbi:hypothetical protein C8R45DRAFT_176711 [Mycena sanguinolenta]|nr:hypothetical protein C8R45DRAFT_176711 [Mycena sanguinolenta]
MSWMCAAPRSMLLWCMKVVAAGQRYIRYIPPPLRALMGRVDPDSVHWDQLDHPNWRVVTSARLTVPMRVAGSCYDPPLEDERLCAASTRCVDGGAASAFYPAGIGQLEGGAQRDSGECNQGRPR